MLNSIKDVSDNGPGTADRYQAKLTTPFATLGIITLQDALTGIEFLPTQPALAPSNKMAEYTWRALEAYLDDPQYQFNLPLRFHGTPHQQKLWHALLEIPVGEVQSYGALAKSLKSSPRAIGQACGANPLPIIIPCHRVVSSQGLGGFMNSYTGDPLSIKQWLLRHEGWPSSGISTKQLHTSQYLDG